MNLEHLRRWVMGEPRNGSKEEVAAASQKLVDSAAVLRAVVRPYAEADDPFEELVNEIRGKRRANHANGHHSS